MRIFANSLPKSGTFLLARLLELLEFKNYDKVFLSQFVVSVNLKAPFFSFSNLKNNYCFFNREKKGICVDNDSLANNYRIDSFISAIEEIPKDTYIFGHTGYTAKMVDILESKNFKTLFIVRDPRDVMVSLYNYVLKHKSHFAHSIAKKRSMEQFLSLYMQKSFGVFDNFPALKKVNLKNQLLNSAFWLNDKRVCGVRFEDLIGSRGGGDDKKQKETVNKILNYLEIDVTEDKLKYICDNLFYAKANTFSKGQIGSYREHFNDKVLEIYRNTIEPYAKLIGYE